MGVGHRESGWRGQKTSSARQDPRVAPKEAHIQHRALDAWQISREESIACLIEGPVRQPVASKAHKAQREMLCTTHLDTITHCHHGRDPNLDQAAASPAHGHRGWQHSGRQRERPTEVEPPDEPTYDRGGDQTPRATLSILQQDIKAVLSWIVAPVTDQMQPVVPRA